MRYWSFIIIIIIIISIIVCLLRRCSFPENCIFCTLVRTFFLVCIYIGKAVRLFVKFVAGLEHIERKHCGGQRRRLPFAGGLHTLRDAYALDTKRGISHPE